VSPAPKRPPKPKSPKPWRRAEAGRYRSADERFSLESDGAGRWFVTDSDELDELGLARTSGPFATLDAAKAAADGTRDRPPAASPLADRLADAKARPKRERLVTAAPAVRTPAPKASPSSVVAPALPVVALPPPRTWLDELADRDADAATRATRLIEALEREGIAGADALVRRDVLGDRPAVATRLLARDVLAAIARLRDPGAGDLAAAVAAVLAASPRRAGLPGWELLERDGPGDRRRPIRLTGDDLAAAALDRGPVRDRDTGAG